MTNRSNIRRVILAGVVVLVGIQFVPVDTTNPPVGLSVVAPGEVLEILERACFDCHSHETKWPWYSRVAPVSWWVASHVREGRGDLNFSTWPLLGSDEEALALKDIETQLVEGEMPPGYYELAHRSARLSEEEVDTLLDWARRR